MPSVYYYTQLWGFVKDGLPRRCASPIMGSDSPSGGDAAKRQKGGASAEHSEAERGVHRTKRESPEVLSDLPLSGALRQLSPTGASLWGCGLPRRFANRFAMTRPPSSFRARSAWESVSDRLSFRARSAWESVTPVPFLDNHLFV